MLFKPNVTCGPLKIRKKYYVHCVITITVVPSMERICSKNSEVPSSGEVDH